MARKRPENRFQEIIQKAPDVFIAAQGYRQTQMDDVAQALGISKGTLYLAVESKAALFDLLVQYADRPEEFSEPDDLPLPTPPEGSTRDYVVQRLISDPALGQLQTALQQETPADPAAELAALVSALYRAQYNNRNAIKLVDTCAVDHPELADVWYQGARGGIMSMLVPFIERRTKEGVYRRVPDIAVTARQIQEMTTLWGIHIHWDPSPQLFDPAHIEATLVDFVQRTLLIDPPS